MAWPREDTYWAISLSVEKDNPAVGLYERHGFRKVREDDGAYTMQADLAVPKLALFVAVLPVSPR